MSELEYPTRIFRGRETVLSEYGFFLIVADGRRLPDPDDDMFSLPLKVCHAMKEVVYFLSYPPMQEVDCVVESWMADPPAGSGEEPYQEQVEVRAMLSGKTCSVTGIEDYLVSIPLARPGWQRVRVQVSGRSESERVYKNNPVVETDGIEKWRIQIWPSLDD